ncbi:PREDICTED: DNA repair protein SWI5 homolog isoform X4 [Condylura cristata]|uniref:DNA repair protein SWI5 homolog isoform X4 n=1 Tax=Condylura cristata TaxID=143302 RepID=UPI000643C464|nr:PREDICTED: DNA repair protein SWI5 homolog isoform X4 [Condylura cristata]
MQSRSALFLLGPPPAPPHPHSTGSRPGRSPGPLSLAPLGSLCRTPPGRASSCRGAFRSPRPCPRSGQADGANDGSLPFDIQKLKEKRDTLDKEIAQLVSEVSPARWQEPGVLQFTSILTLRRRQLTHT